MIDLTLDGVTNPAAGSHQLSVATSSDAAAKSASYQVLAPGVGPADLRHRQLRQRRLAGPVVGSIVQACDGSTCVEAPAPTDNNGDYSLYVPSAASTRSPRFPQPERLQRRRGRATPAAVTVAGPNTVNVTLPAIAPVPTGVTLPWQSATVGNVYWGCPVPLSVAGLPRRRGIAV